MKQDSKVDLALFGGIFAGVAVFLVSIWIAALWAASLAVSPT